LSLADMAIVMTPQIFIAKVAQTVSCQQISTGARYSCGRNAIACFQSESLVI